MDNINETNYNESIKYNADNTVNVPFVVLQSEGFIKIERTPSAVDFLEGTTIVIRYSTWTWIKKDRSCWYWTMYCSGDGLSDCQNRRYKGNLKNAHDMQLCQVRVISECRISWLNPSTPLKISTQNLPTRDMILKSRRADPHTAKRIKMKMLAPLNGASEEKNQRSS
ncbi:hypothetical protein GLOIN_2v1868524 [Rhizophagus clarus]|uniref:Uncharacterized protein n=1 Tax=Rhizophagus clarus TaxID=94130 RepID=A0A8H3KRW6_9GLOM|nr:hypothetical protein GLOIN_2v1868524 [Rhizophagus clarus]